MTDVERVKGFGKTLKAFQAVADQLNRIADLDAAQEEAERGADAAQKELFNLTVTLDACKKDVKGAYTNLEHVKEEVSEVIRKANNEVKFVLADGKQEAEGWIQEAHDAADQIRLVNEVNVSELKRQQDALLDENEKLTVSLEELHSEMALLKKRFS